MATSNSAVGLKSLNHSRVPEIKRVAVIGSGVAGLAAAKYLLAESFEVTIFERRSEVAGIWNLTSPTPSPSNPFPTPMYENLRINVPRALMTYSDFPYPDDAPLFPSHEVVKRYLDDYSSDIQHCIQFNSEVEQLNKYNGNWNLAVTHTSKDGTRTEKPHDFDAVVVATGTFNKPYIPNGIEYWINWGLRGTDWMHSADYRRPQQFAGKKVLMVGGGAVYRDISRQIAPYVREKIIVSTLNPLNDFDDESRRNVPKVKHLDPEERAVTFADDSTENNIDIIMLCTGYRFEYPFIPKVQIKEDVQQVCELWEHMFWIPDPTLAFVGLPRMSTTFILSEVQGAYIASVFSRRSTLPGEEIMRQELEEEIELSANAKRFHDMVYPKDKDYINHLYHRSRQRNTEGGAGKTPPYYGTDKEWLRKNAKAMYAAFEAKGDERDQCTSPECLGFEYWAKRYLEEDY